MSQNVLAGINTDTLKHFNDNFERIFRKDGDPCLAPKQNMQTIPGKQQPEPGQDKSANAQ